jgi:hypothetical protein
VENKGLKEFKAFREKKVKLALRATKAFRVFREIKVQKATRETRVSLATLL